MGNRERGQRGDRRGRGGPRGGPRGRRRKKVCIFCVSPRDNVIDYKNVNLLKRFLDEDARIRKARQTGTCRKHQSQVAMAIKRGREIALLPYVPD